MAYEDLFTYVGDFGRYQKRIYFLLCLTAIPCGFHKMAGVFINAVPDFRCQLPFESTNATIALTESRINLYIPYDSFTKKPSKCEYYNASELNMGNETKKSMICDHYVYDHSRYKSSTVMEWDMVCGNTWLRATADALFMCGVLLGSIIFGQMSDKIGRKPVFFMSLVLQVIFGVITGFAPNYIVFVISRMLIGATTSGVFIVAYVLAMEMVGPTSRMFAGVAVQMFFTIGFILVGGFAFFFTDWRHLQIAITLPGIVFMCYYWFIPESARWLLAKNRKDEAMKIIDAVIKENKSTVPKEVLDSIRNEQREEKGSNTREASLIDLFRYPNLRKKTLIIFLSWFVNSCAYYGLSWNTGNLGGNDIVSFVISGVVEFPAYIFLLYTLNRWGRRILLCGCMLVAGIMLLFCMIIPTDYTYGVITLAMAGKMAITASYGTIYIFTTEQFPTPVRNVGLGASSMMARIGGILAPYINALSAIWPPFPLLVFGIMAFISGMLSLYLPETLNKKLPETIEEGEHFGKKVKKRIDLENADAEDLKKLNTNGDTTAPKNGNDQINDEKLTKQ